MFLLSFLFLLSPLHLMSFMSLVSLPCILPLLPFSSTQYLHYLNIVLSDQGKNCEIGPIKWNLEELDKSGQNDISKLWHHFARFRLCWVSHFFNTTTSHSYIFHVYLPGRPRRNLLAGGAGQALLVVEAGLAPHHVHQEDLGSAPACTVQWMSVVIIRWLMVGWQHCACLHMTMMIPMCWEHEFYMNAQCWGDERINKTLPKALRTQVLTALTSNFGLVGLVQYAR